LHGSHARRGCSTHCNLRAIRHVREHYPPPMEVPQAPAPAAQSEGEARTSVHLQPARPGDVMRTCANCGSAMEERKCKLICRGCGYFLSCSDYY
jgi:hypothetical protein